MKYVKRNIIFIILFVAAILCIVTRNTELNAPVVSHPDSQLVFSTGQSVMEQTWQPHVKRITGVRVFYTASADFNSNMNLEIYTDDYSQLLAQTSLYQEFHENEAGTLEFRFNSLGVVQGDRYRIQLSYDNPSADGSLLIASGSNYGGCSIDNENCNEAAAFEIIFLKNSRLFWAFAVFFPFISFSLLFMLTWNRKWEECIGLAVICTTAILYVFGLFEKLMAGMVAIYVLAVVSLLVSIYIYNKKNIPMKNLLSPALFLYAVFFLIILINCRNVWFGRADEYSHWGTAVKDMFYYQSFAKHLNTTVLFPRYLPFATLIEYFFVYANGMFAQAMVYVAFQTVLLSILIVLCRFKKDKWQYFISSITIIVGIPIIFFSDIYNCIYVDPLLAVLGAYVLFCYYAEDMTGFNLLRIIGGLFALTTTKEMGMVIAGLLTVIMMGDRLCQSIRQKKSIIKNLIRPGLCVVFVIAVFIGWQIYISIPVRNTVQITSNSVSSAKEETSSTFVSSTKAEITSTLVASAAEEASGTPVASTAEENSNIPADNAVSEISEVESSEVQFESTFSASRISLDGILGLFGNEDGGYRYRSIKNFITALFDKESFWLGNIGVSYIDMFIMILVLIAGLGFVKFWGPNANRMMAFGILVLPAGICYALVLEIMYLFAFSEVDAFNLPSLGRYLGSFLGGVVIALAGLIVKQAAERDAVEKSNNRMVVFILTAVIIICIPMRGFVFKNMDTDIPEDCVYGYDDMAEVLRSFAVKGENVYYICNGSTGESYHIFRTYVSPLLSSYMQYNIYTSNEAYLEQVDIWTQNGEEVQNRGLIISCDDWEKKLLNCQYLFIFHPDDVFEESYGSLFAEPDTIGDGTFYEVRKSDEKVTLEYIGKVGVKDYK